MTPSTILAKALALPALLQAPQAIPGGSLCELQNCGRPISAGYPRGALTTDATNEQLDTFRGATGWICEDCARVFKASSPHANYMMGRAWLAFADGSRWDPLIAREAAAKSGRACWSDLLREVWPARQGQECVILLTTDGKKRTWPQARSGCLGEKTPLCLHNTDSKFGECSIHSGNLYVAWEQLLRYLQAIETMYGAGFAKRHIAQSLLEAAACREVGLQQSYRWEQEIRAWRGRPEFAVALIVAQKPTVQEQPAPQPSIELPPEGQLAFAL